MRQTIILKTDNKELESILISKNSADLFLTNAIRWICMFARDHKVRFYIKYIHTKVNKIPDALSRFNKEEALKEVEATKFTPRWCKNVVFPLIDVW